MSQKQCVDVLNLLYASDAEFYKDFSDLNEYYDLFLIHPDGEIYYTAAREADYQTNILNGRFADSSLGRVMRQALLSPEDEVFADFQPYEPSGNAPAAFISRPIRYDSSRENSANQGLSFGIQTIVALQLSDSTLNEVMLQRTGLGETGEPIWLVLTSNYAPAPEIPTVTWPPLSVVMSLSMGPTPNPSGWPLRVKVTPASIKTTTATGCWPPSLRLKCITRPGP